MWYLFLALMLFPAAVFAQDLESVDTVTSLLVEAIRSEQWLVVAGLATTLIVLVARKTGLLAQIPKKYVPWVATAVAILSAFATSLISGVSLTTALTQGIIVGTAATGFWEMLFKHTGAKAE